MLASSGATDLAGMMRLDLMFRDKVKDLIPPRHRSKLQEHVNKFLIKKMSRYLLFRTAAGSSGG